MELIKWNPTREMFGLRNRLNTLFDDFFYPDHWFDKGEGVSGWNPVVDIYENDDGIVVKAELPGVKKEDIKVDVEGRYMTLKGERSSENEVKEDKFYRRERSYGRFKRVFTLPVEIDPKAIKAEYKDGVLNITIPKPEERKPKQITVH